MSKPIDIQPYRLADGTWAFDEPAPVWWKNP